jgi:uncharacterized protein
MGGDLRVADNPIELRYELHLGETLVGFVRYRREPGRLVLVHTEVDPAVEGQGFGSHLVAETLDDIRTRGLAVVPLCPFIAAYIRRNPECADLVAPDTGPG